MPKKTCFLTLVLLILVVLGSWNPALAGQKKREKKAASWPAVDLTPYSVLYVEDIRVTDPKAGKRKNVALVKAAPMRIEGYLVATVEEGLFAEIRQASMEPVSGAVALRVELTQYKPGSAFGRAMLAGVGSAHLDFKATLIDAESGERLTSFTGEKTWAWGGAYGMSRGIEELEQNLAVELALYLKRCKGGDTNAAAAHISQVDQ